MINQKEAFSFKNICVENNNKQIQAHFKLTKYNPYFEGHFPSTPLFPAFGVVDNCLELLRQIYNDPKIKAITSAKFKGMIFPDDEIFISAIEVESKKWKIKLTKGAAPIAQLRIQIA